MPKDDNKVKQDETAAEQAAEAAEVPATATANSTTDEEAVKAGEAEQGVGAGESMPAEVAAINSDNETARQASGQKPSEQKELKSANGSESQTEEKPAPPGPYAELIKQIENLKVTELTELVKALEDRFGVSAAAPVAMGPAASGSSASAAPVEEKSSYTVVLADGGAQKIAAIKAVRELRQDLGLKEAKDLVDGAPKEVLKDIKKDEAEAAKAKLETAGAKVELK